MINNILYMVGGERASGAEIVIERLMINNGVQSHLFISPGSFSTALTQTEKPYQINIVERLKKLNRRSSSALVFYLKAARNYFLIPKLVLAYIKKHRIDVVHCNTIGQAAYMLPLVFLRPVLCPKVKWVWTDHDLKYYFFLDNFLSEQCAKAYDITFAVSEAVKRKYKHADKVAVLYNGLDLEIFKPDEQAGKNFKTNLKLSDSSIVIGCAGVMSKRKGQLDLVAAFSRLKQQYGNVNLLLAGRFDNDELEYNEQVRAALKTGGVIYAGQVDDMVGFYNACDIVVSNADLAGSEPLGTTIYEAMACQKIVVGSDTGGTKEIIDNNINGYLFQAENVDALLNKLTEVISDLNGHEQIKKAARKKVKDIFDINIMAKKYHHYLINL